MRGMRRSPAARALRALALCGLGTACFISCHAKSVVVCEKLEDCGLLAGTADQCVDQIREGFADNGVDAKMLTHCIDCLGLKFCSEIERGLCEEDCGEVLRQLRRTDNNPRNDGGASGAGGEAGAKP